MGINTQADDRAADVMRRLVRRGMSEAALRGTPPAALAEFDRYLTSQDGGLSTADADQYEENQEVAKLKNQCEKFSESGTLPSAVGDLIRGFRAERKHGPDPHLTAEDFLGRR